MMKFLFIFLLSYTFYIRQIASKAASGEFKLTGKDFHYLARFGCSIGACPYSFRFRVVAPWASVSKAEKSIKQVLLNSRPTSLKLRFMLDETWEASPVNRRPHCDTLHMSHFEQMVSLPLDGTWSEWTKGTLTQVIRPHLWYFLADDCQSVITSSLSRETHTPERDIKSLTLRWEAYIRQPSGSHFSYELLGTFFTSCCHILCYTGILLFMGIYEFREMKRSGHVHTMIQILNACVLTQLSSSLLHFCHLLAYAYTGQGISFLDFVAEVLAAVSQIALSSMLMFIAFGYTLNISSPHNLETMGAGVAFGVTLLHVFLVTFDKFNADPRFKSHAADGYLGIVFAILRLLLWMGFVLRCHMTSQDNSTTFSTAHFLRRFAYAGSLYFLAYPIVFGITTLFAPYLQHKVLTNGIFLMQAGSMLWLSTMFLTRGEYFKVSEFGQSYLPGGYLSSRGVHRID